MELKSHRLRELGLFSLDCHHEELTLLSLSSVGKRRNCNVGMRQLHHYIYSLILGSPAIDLTSRVPSDKTLGAYV